MVENAARELLTFDPPLAVHFVGRLENVVDGRAEPFVDASINQAERKAEQKNGRYQSQGNQRHEETGLELRAGLLLAALDPDLDERSQKDESRRQAGPER